MFINPTKETLELTRHSLANGRGPLHKCVTISTGLTWYNLQAPAKNIYPVITPLRNSIPRVHRANASDAARWRQVTALTGSGYDAMGWVPEGQRSGTMSYTTAQKSAAYVTLGEEDYLTFEAEAAAQGLEDEDSMVTLRLLQKMMRKEEVGLLAGNASLVLGVPATPVLSASGSGATLPSATYSVIVAGLTLEGWKNASLSNGVATTKTITGADGKTFVLNGGTSNKSEGALKAITTLNSVIISAPLASGRQAAAVIAGDSSSNPNYAFEGLLTQSLNPNNLAYVNTLATGTAGTGTTLTPSGRGSVIEIDTMLQSMWGNYRISPTVLYVNSQELRNFTNKVLGTGTSSLYATTVAAVSTGCLTA